MGKARSKRRGAEMDIRLWQVMLNLGTWNVPAPKTITSNSPSKS